MTALSVMKVQHMQASVCQQESTPGVSISSRETPAVCLISWQSTWKSEVVWREGRDAYGWREREEVKERRGEREREGKDMKGQEDEKKAKRGRRGDGKIS